MKSDPIVRIMTWNMQNILNTIRFQMFTRMKNGLRLTEETQAFLEKTSTTILLNTRSWVFALYLIAL